MTLKSLLGTFIGERKMVKGKHIGGLGRNCNGQSRKVVLAFEITENSIKHFLLGKPGGF
jgi:hypothetical protein